MTTTTSKTAQRPRRIITVVAPMYVVRLTGVESVTQLEDGGPITLHYENGRREKSASLGKRLAGKTPELPGDFESFFDVVSFVQARRPRTVLY